MKKIVKLRDRGIYYGFNREFDGDYHHTKKYLTTWELILASPAGAVIFKI